MRFGGTADAFMCITSLRGSRIIRGLVTSWIHGIPDLTVSLTIQCLLFFHCDVVLQVRIFPLFVEVDLDIAFPESMLSSADVVQRILEFVGCVTSGACSA